MKSEVFPDVRHPVDEVRKILCAHVAQTLLSGSLCVRVRILKALGEALFYEHSNNTWRIQNLVIREPALVQALSDELAQLASKPHGDVLHVRHHIAPIWQETELLFHRSAIGEHRNGNLESYIRGILFGDRHDSKQDARRRAHWLPEHTPAHRHGNGSPR